MCVAGAIYKNECPIQRFIPIYLIVGGAFALWMTLGVVVMFLCLAKDPESNNEHNVHYSAFCKFSEALVGWFTIVWFIAGECYLSISLYLSGCRTS